MGSTANNDTAASRDTQYNLDQVMEVLFTGEAFVFDEATPPVAFNPFYVFIQGFDKIDVNIGTTCHALKNFAVTAAQPQAVGEALGNHLTQRTIVAGNSDDIGMSFLLGRLVAFVSVGDHRGADQRIDQSFNVAFHGHYYDSLWSYNNVSCLFVGGESTCIDAMPLFSL
jgi:hypothetical protein